MHVMEERSVIHNTFVIERSFPAAAERVFAAFADPGKKRRWFVEGDGHEVEQFEMDFQIGGRESARMRFKEGTPLAGYTFDNDATYLDIVPNSRIVIAARMSVGGKPISVALATFELSPSNQGTDLIFTHQAVFFEGADGPAMREGGWRRLFDRLSQELSR